MILIYRIIINLILLLSPIIIIFRLFKKKEDFRRFKEKFCFFSKKRKKGKIIWFHGASVGEIKSIIPLLEKFEKDRKISQILITSNTLSSSKIISNIKLKKIIHQFFPIDVKFISKPLLQKSANNYGVTFFLSRLRDQGVEIIYVETPSKNQLSFLHPGHGFRPMHACSCAKVIAAYASDNFQLNIIHSRLKSYTRNTRVNPSLLKSEFKKIRAKGYAECIEEIDIGICSVAAPVIIKNSNIFLSIGATGPLRTFSDTFREKIGNYLIGISNELGSMIQNKNIWTKNINTLAS